MMRFWRSAYGRRKELLAGADALIASDIYLLPLGLAMTANTRMPLLYDAREDWAALEAARRPRSVREIVTRAETALARRTSAVIVPGESRARRWRRDGIEPVVLRNVAITAPRAGTAPRWDVASAGLLAEQRRPDLVLGLAARRPDLRFVITGVGRLEDDVRAKAQAMPNVDFLGFVDDVDDVLAKSRVIVYGEDPNTPYSPLVCPSTLYQAVRLRRPLVFYCGGEPAEAAGRFRIGVRCDPDVEALSDAVDTARAGDDWEFDDAVGVAERGRRRGVHQQISLARARAVNVRRRVVDAARSLGVESHLRRVQRVVASSERRRDWQDNRHIELLLAYTLPEDANCIDVGASEGDILQHMVRLAPRGRHIAVRAAPRPRGASAPRRSPVWTFGNVRSMTKPATRAFPSACARHTGTAASTRWDARRGRSIRSTVPVRRLDDEVAA